MRTHGQCYPDELVIEILKEYKRGKTSYDLAEEFAVSQNTIEGWAKKAGIHRQVNRKRESWEKIRQALQ